MPFTKATASAWKKCLTENEYNCQLVSNRKLVCLVTAFKIIFLFSWFRWLKSEFISSKSIKIYDFLDRCHFDLIKTYLVGCKLISSLTVLLDVLTGMMTVPRDPYFDISYGLLLSRVLRYHENPRFTCYLSKSYHAQVQQVEQLKFVLNKYSVIATE